MALYPLDAMSLSGSVTQGHSFFMYNLSHLIIAPLLTVAVLPSSAGEQLIGFVV